MRAQQQLGREGQRGRTRRGRRGAVAAMRSLPCQITLARIRSLELSAPTSRPASSTTSTLVMRCCSITPAASTASASARTRRGLRCITSAAVSARRSAPRSMRRRRSPSVKMPIGRPVAVDHGGEAQALAGHLAQQFVEAGAGRHLRHGVAAAHEVAHVHQQLAAERAAGVRAREVLLAKAARVEQRHRQRVAQRHLRRGAGGGRQVQRAGLLVHGAGQHACRRAAPAWTRAGRSSPPA